MEQILFVAPTETIANNARQVGAKMDISFPIVTSKLDEIGDVVKQYPDIHVFISRGGLAERLGEITDSTVIEIKATLHDTFQAIQKIATVNIDKIAVCLHSSATGDASLQDYRLGNTEIYFRSFHKPQEVNMLLSMLAQKGIKGVAGTRLAVEVAVSNGFAGEYIEPSETAIAIAVQDALKIAKAQENERQRAQKRAEQMQHLVNKIYAALEQSVAAVQELAASSQELGANSQQTVTIAEAAVKEVKSTTEILQIIRQVAQQTNLLGLNAAIEAARAGESGRGFSVVASEVRKLAETSGNSVSYINDVLKSFQSSVENVRKNIQHTNLITQEQAKATQEISQRLEEIQAIVENLLRI